MSKALTQYDAPCLGARHDTSWPWSLGLVTIVRKHATARGGWGHAHPKSFGVASETIFRPKLCFSKAKRQNFTAWIFTFSIKRWSRLSDRSLTLQATPFAGKTIRKVVGFFRRLTARSHLASFNMSPPNRALYEWGKVARLKPAQPDRRLRPWSLPSWTAGYCICITRLSCIALNYRASFPFCANLVLECCGGVGTESGNGGCGNSGVCSVMGESGASESTSYQWTKGRFFSRLTAPQVGRKRSAISDMYLHIPSGMYRSQSHRRLYIIYARVYKSLPWWWSHSVQLALCTLDVCGLYSNPLSTWCGSLARLGQKWNRPGNLS